MFQGALALALVALDVVLGILAPLTLERIGVVVMVVISPRGALDHVPGQSGGMRRRERRPG